MYTEHLLYKLLYSLYVNVFSLSKSFAPYGSVHPFYLYHYLLNLCNMFLLALYKFTIEIEIQLFLTVTDLGGIGQNMPPPHSIF